MSLLGFYSGFKDSMAGFKERGRGSRRMMAKYFSGDLREFLKKHTILLCEHDLSFKKEKFFSMSIPLISK